MRTVTDLEFQEVDYILCRLHPRLGVDVPCGTHRPEITPTVLLGETRRGVTAIGCGDIVLAVVVVLGLCQDTLRCIVVRQRTRLRIENGVANLGYIGREEFGLLTVVGRVGVVVVLVTEQEVHIVQTGETVVVGKEVLLVDRQVTVALDIRRAARSGVLTIEGVHGLLVTAAKIVDTDIGSGFQTLIELYGCVPLACEHIVGIFRYIECDCRSRVGLTHEGTLGTCCHRSTVTIVINGIAVVVDGDRTVGVAHIERVDRRHEVADIEEVTRRSGGIVTGLLGRILLVGMRITHRSAEFEPFLCLIVHIDTARKTLIVRVLDDTRVVQVTCRSKVVDLVCRAGHIEVVLLTEVVGLEEFVVPTVGRIVVVAVVVAERGVGVEFAVGTDKALPRRNGIDLIAETAVVGVEQIGVGILVGIGRGLTRKELAVVKTLIECLVVHGRVGHHRVGRHLARVGTPLGIDGDLCVLGVTAAGGNQHHTIGTTRTV